MVFSMKIAVIGSGVSGLVSAYLLAPHHKVVMFEKNARIGGHAHTLTVKEGSQSIPVDNGFMVYNPERYPNFIKLLDELGVASIQTNMSFSVSIPNTISYRGDVPYGLFADTKNLFNGRFWKFLIEIIRFRRVAKNMLQHQLHTGDTLQQFIERYGFSPDLGTWFLFPMLSAIWSMKDSDRVGDFPALATFTFLNNHRLLDNAQPTWRTIMGGSIQYVSKIEKFLKHHGVRIVRNAHVTNIVRSNRSVTIRCGTTSETFDYVILATHADTTKQLLSDISKEEDAALSQFTYSVNTTVLHKDTRMVSKNPALLASWNFIQTARNVHMQTRAMFTYCMNKLQHISMSTPVFVTLNPDEVIDKKNIYAVEEYAHPEYNLVTLLGQQRVAKLQGNRRTLFAGAYLGYGFHEDGVVSAVNAVKKLGIEPPWGHL
jgi:predicted NAD/FAD-binding protein